MQQKLEMIEQLHQAHRELLAKLLYDEKLDAAAERLEALKEEHAFYYNELPFIPDGICQADSGAFDGMKRTNGIALSLVGEKLSAWELSHESLMYEFQQVANQLDTALAIQRLETKQSVEAITQARSLAGVENSENIIQLCDGIMTVLQGQ